MWSRRSLTYFGKKPFVILYLQKIDSVRIFLYSKFQGIQGIKKGYFEKKIKKYLIK